MDTPKLVKITTLDIQRKHQKSCTTKDKKTGKLRQTGATESCPSASKKKCPYRIFGYGLDEHGNRVKIRKSLRTNDQETAARELLNFRANVEGLNVVVAKAKPTVEEAMTQFFTEEEERGVSSETLKSFHKFLDRERDKERFSPSLIMYAKAENIRLLNQFTPEHIKKWRGQWLLGHKTKTKQWERVRQFFQYAEDAEWVDVNPVAKIKGFVKDRDDLPVTALSEEEEQVILDACGDDEFARTYMMVLRWSGLAMVDAIQLKPEKLNGDFLQTYRTKTGVPVGLPLPPELVERLNALPIQEGGYWFWNRMKDGSDHQTATGNMRRRLRPIYRKAGVLIKGKDGQPIPMVDKKAPIIITKTPEGIEKRTRPVKRDASGKIVHTIVHSHQWRHTFVKDLLDKGKSIEMIADLLGDTYKVVADTYSNLIAERQKKLNEAVRTTFRVRS